VNGSAIPKSSDRVVDLLVHRSDANIADRGLELDKRVGVVVLVAWVRFAVLAEVGIMAHSALVARTLDVREVLLVLAKRSIAIDTVVTATA
jgi:hypothetical protein